MARGRWIHVGERAGAKPSAGEKLAITAACQRFLAEVLKPRYLPVIEPTEFNYPIAIYGKWHGNKYRFITRYRSDRKDAIEPEFEAPFAGSSSSRETDLTCLTSGTPESGSVFTKP